MSDVRPANIHDLVKEFAATEAHEIAMSHKMDTLQLITFTKNEAPGRTIPIGRHPANNRVVFPDAKRLGGSIKVGDSYFCELSEYHPDSGPSVYYANPIIKVDASYLFDLRPEQMDRLIAALEKTTQGKLLDQARAAIRLELETASRVRLDALQTERDEARSQADSVKAELAREVAAGKSLQGEVATLNALLKETQANQKEEPDLDPQSSQPLTNWPPAVIEEIGATSVLRPRAEQIESPYFKEGRYFVHVAPNRKLILVRPRKEGNLVAVGRRITIPGLSVLRPFDFPERLPAAYDSRSEGLLVDLSGPINRPPESP